MQIILKPIWVGSMMFCIVAMAASGLLADDPPAVSEHASITQYAKAISAMNDKYGVHLKNRDALGEEFRQVYTQFAAAGAEAENLNSQANNEFRNWMAAFTQKALDQSQLQQMNNNNIDTRNANNTANQMRLRAASAEAVENNASMRVAQLQIAQQLNSQRQQRLQQELGKLGVKAQGWMMEEMQIIREYASQADIANTRSDLELKSARRLLEPEIEAKPDNHGARLALAITLMRSDDKDAAQQLLTTIINENGPATLLAKAARAEMFAAADNEQSAKKDLGAVKPLKVPESLHFQARTFERLDELKQAENIWTGLAKSSEFEVIAHCHLALLQIGRRPTPAKAKKALIDSQLAIDLSGGDDWHCHLTHAMCLYAAGQKEQALEVCKKAAELAIGNKQELCNAQAEKIKLGQPMDWQL